MRVFIAGLMHETNTFSPIPTSFASFERHRSADLEYRSSDAVDTLAYGTFAQRALDAGDAVFAGVFAHAQPSAPLNAPDHQRLKSQILGDLESCLPIDIAFLFMHGAQVAEGCDDVEGDLVSAVRAVTGPDCAIGLMLDLHANLSVRMIEQADLVMSCLEYPHTDYAARTLKAFDILRATALKQIRPRMVARRVPVLGLYTTLLEPTQGFVRRLRAAEAADKVLAISMLHGFFLADTPWTSAASIAVTHGDPELAERLAEDTAADFLACVPQVDRGLDLQSGLDRALSSPQTPVVLADSADNPGGGAAGDSTFVLRALLERRVEGAAMALMWDPMAVQFAHAVGEGRRFRMRLGGKVGPSSGAPLDVEAEVLSLRQDARQALFAQGEPRSPLGASAAVRVGGVDIVINSERQQVFDPRCFTEHGVDPLSKRLLVVKSSTHFRNGFAPFAGRIIRCEAPGSVTEDLRSLDFRHLPRPVYPLDSTHGLKSTPFARR